MKNFQLLLFLLSFWACSTQTAQKIDMSGEWQFQLDSLDVGITEKWYLQDFTDSVQLPGSMVENEKGFDITINTKWTGGIRNPEWYKDLNYAPYYYPDNIKFPFWLQPLKKYTGAAWYQRKVTIPEDWKGKNVWLNLERPHWETTVWVNDKKAGEQNSLATPHKYNISSLVKVGENSISVRIDNRTKDVDVGWNSHSITDHTQTNWNGVVGDISLQSGSEIYFKDVQIFPDIKENMVDIKAVVNNTSLLKTKVKIAVVTKLKKTDHEAGIKRYELSIPAGESTVALECPLDEKALKWDEFNPNVYALSVEIDYPEGKDKQSVDFGFRNFEGDSTGFSINGHRTFLRGTLDCAIFPKTGYPPTNIKDWKKEFTAIKSHGLNHVRFHSWCPPEAAFVAADEMGVYLQVECSSWANQSTQLGSGCQSISISMMKVIALLKPTETIRLLS